MEWEEKVIEVIDRQSWLDTIGKPVQQWITKAYQAGGRAGQQVADIFHGTWLGHPLHAVLTDLPIGAYSVALGLDALEMTTGRKEFGIGADNAIALGVGGAVGSAVTGLTDWQHTVGHQRRVGALHALLNISALVFYILSLVYRGRRKREAGWGTAMLGFGLTTAAAYLGGHMVYSDKVGVDHAPEPETLPEMFTPVMAEADLPENQLHKAMVNNIPILLVRRGERIYALAETCAHLGGPLAEGELTDDNTVICPWHGSRFRLEDGSIVNGPTVYREPCFETRVRNGQIEVLADQDRTG